MPEISEVHFVNAAHALKKYCSASDALHGATLCIIEDSDGGIHVAAGQTHDEALTRAEGQLLTAAAGAEGPQRVPVELDEAQAEPAPEALAEAAAEPAPKPARKKAK